jgi:hypothetical protein
MNIFGIKKGASRMSSRPAPPVSRAERSHVNKDGEPKRVYETREAAMEVATHLFIWKSRRLFPYVCWMNPEHWHLSGQEPDLV